MNDKGNETVTIEDIIELARKTQPEADLDVIYSAYELARKAHEGQKRASGEEYIIHPLNVAKILCDMHLDEATISAALLHDVVEDTTYTIEEMQFELKRKQEAKRAVEQGMQEWRPTRS